MKKRLFFAFVAVILCCSFVFVFYLSRHKISLMNEQECIQYLKSAGVNISENYDITVIKKQLSELETDSDHPAQLMSTPDRFYEQIRVLVKMYYNEPELSENTVLSKMDKNECKDFLVNVGVQIPYDYDMSMVQDLLAEFEKNHNLEAPEELGHWSETIQLYDQLRVVVNMYYK